MMQLDGRVFLRMFFDVKNMMDLGRVDDIWSLFYMIVEFTSGQLPWRRITEKDEVGTMKEHTPVEVLLQNCPSEFSSYNCYLQGLKFPDKPDYQRLHDLMNMVCRRLSYHREDPYDWELSPRAKMLMFSSSALSADINAGKTRTRKSVVDGDLDKIYGKAEPGPK